MTKREQYSLTFNKIYLEGYGLEHYIDCEPENTTHSMLIRVGRLYEGELDGFISDLNRSIDQGSNYDVGFFSDSVEDITVKYEYPNVNWDDVYTISMVDLRDIMLEWKEYLNKEKSSCSFWDFLPRWFRKK